MKEMDMHVAWPIGLVTGSQALISLSQRKAAAAVEECTDLEDRACKSFSQKI